MSRVTMNIRDSILEEVEEGIKSARERPLISHEDALKRLHATLERARRRKIR